MAINASEQTLREWAQRLHDESLQGIGAVRMRLAAARKGDPDRLHDAVDEAIEQLASEIATLRSLIGELRPAALDELGLVEALRDLVDIYVEAGLDVELQTTIDASEDLHSGLDTEVESVIFRVVQEALADAGTHAEAGRLMIHLRPTVGGVALTVTDDGAGYSKRRLERARSVERLRERIELVGGALQVSSAAGATTLRARLPLSANGSAPAQDQVASPSMSPRSSA